MFQFALLFFEPEQSLTDVLVMSAHHLATLVLLGMSYIYSFHRFGAIVLCLHDLADPFMESAKLFLYAGFPQVSSLT